jgi:hypothetical protein
MHRHGPGLPSRKLSRSYQKIIVARSRTGAQGHAKLLRSCHSHEPLNPRPGSNPKPQTLGAPASLRAQAHGAALKSCHSIRPGVAPGACGRLIRPGVVRCGQVSLPAQAVQNPGAWFILAGVLKILAMLLPVGWLTATLDIGFLDWLAMFPAGIGAHLATCSAVAVRRRLARVRAGARDPWGLVWFRVLNPKTSEIRGDSFGIGS